MARSPLDNISSRAALEGMSPQNGKETRGSERVLASLPKGEGPGLGEKIVARNEPGSGGMGKSSLGHAMKCLAMDHGKKR